MKARVRGKNNNMKKVKKFASFVTLFTLLFSSFAVSVPLAGAEGVGAVCPHGDVKYEIDKGKYEYTDDSATIWGDETTVYWEAGQGCTITSVCIKIGGPVGGELINPDPSLDQWTTGTFGISHVVLTTNCQPLPPQETNVTICKEDEDKNRLPGWELSLTSDTFSATGTTEGQCQNTGCVIFQAVPYGTYQIQEVLKPGWENFSGLGEVEVSSKNPKFTVVNREKEETIKGSITVCKIIIDSEGNIVDGSEKTGDTFMIPGLSAGEIPGTSPAPVGAIPDSEFEAPLGLNADLIGSDQINDAECITYGGLALGGYYYGEESLPSEGWETPLYNDQNITQVTSLGDFFEFSDELLDENPANDGERNTDADGHIVLTESRPDRTLVVLNQYKEKEDVHTNVTLCKKDNRGKNLGGWELSLISDSFSASGTTATKYKNKGCVTFKDVPYGTYQIEEMLKEGWKNISGLIEVEVDSENPTFTVVNKKLKKPGDVFYFLTATTTGSGWVTSSPAGIHCGYEASDCQEEYLEGTEVTLSAIPVGGQKFDGWAGDCSGTSTACVLTMDGAKSVSAAFSLIPGIITYTVTFDGNGGVPTSTDIVVPGGETVNPLPTVSRAGFNFIQWNTADDGSGDTFTTSTTVTGNITVYAIWQEYTIPSIYGCTDPGATNYNPKANKDDSSCTYRRRILSGSAVVPPAILGEEAVVEEPFWCGMYLYEFIKYGANNNPYEVQKLQTFLNQHMGLNLAVSGVYDWTTMQALNQFQLQYKEEVLKPWVDAGVHCDVNQPTGYVYKTTQRWINLIMCPTLNIPMPNLLAYPKADCAGYWGQVLGEDIVVDENGIPEDVVDEETEESMPEEKERMPLDIEEIVTEEPKGERETSTLWLIAIIVLAVVAAIWAIYRGSKN